MSRTAQDPRFEELPDRLAIFPLPGVLLLPGGRLPLNIFEPRYLEMFDDAIASNRLIGMIQPKEPEDNGNVPALYDTGCVGRLTSFSETDDGRYLVNLTGLIRFDVNLELESGNYRLVQPNYQRFKGDLSEDNGPVDRERLLEILQSYFKALSIDGDWQAIERLGDEYLVTAVAMICPLDSPEKQVLLETMTLQERAETLIAILEMAIHNNSDETVRH
ncbi:MAG: LON peptidase substrate-binding domain-containing protein [Pseudomonadota bacterium]